MAIAGRVAIVPKGDWSADVTYKRLDAVTYNNTLYFAKKDVPAGTATSNTEYWSRSIVGGAGAIATTDDAGIVKPDGTTITVDADGTIHGKSEIKVDGTTITLDEAKGIISLAKTLQEKIGTIDDKLPAANVANNQITTVEGFALDARQANPNIDGSLAKQISDLNGSLNTKRFEITFEDGWKSEYPPFVQIIGSIAVIYNLGIYYKEDLALGQTYTIGAYSSEYKGIYKIPVYTSASKYAGLLTFADGKITYSAIADTYHYVCYGCTVILKILTN